MARDRQIVLLIVKQMAKSGKKITLTSNGRSGATVRFPQSNERTWLVGVSSMSTTASASQEFLEKATARCVDDDQRAKQVNELRMSSF